MTSYYNNKFFNTPKTITEEYENKNIEYYICVEIIQFLNKNFKKKNNNTKIIKVALNQSNNFKIVCDRENINININMCYLFFKILNTLKKYINYLKIEYAEDKILTLYKICKCIYNVKNIYIIHKLFRGKMQVDNTNCFENLPNTLKSVMFNTYCKTLNYLPTLLDTLHLNNYRRRKINYINLPNSIKNLSNTLHNFRLPYKVKKLKCGYINQFKNRKNNLKILMFTRKCSEIIESTKKIKNLDILCDTTDSVKKILYINSFKYKTLIFTYYSAKDKKDRQYKINENAHNVVVNINGLKQVNIAFPKALNYLHFLNNSDNNAHYY